ncbi:DUF4956 domain-containing protein [bacterium]|nr:DUF4956 domain-containing protein [bacterium]
MQTLLSYGFEQIEWQVALLSFLLTFVLTTCIALLYEKTYQGLSYSRGLVQSMILGSVVTCLLMISIGDNIARGIGIVGSLAIIRFRTNLREPRDLVFIFASLGVGVSCGVQSYATAVTGTAVFCLVAAVLHVSPFGARRKHDGLLRFQLPARPDAADTVTRILRSGTKHFVLVTLRDVAQGQAFDYSYQVRLANPGDQESLIAELRKVRDIRGLTYINQEATVEV